MSGGGGQPATQTTTTTQELSKEQRQLLDLVIPTAEMITHSPPELFPGSTIAPLDPLQEQAQTNVLELAEQGGALPQLTNQANMASQFLMGPVLFPESNPALAAATDAAIRPLTEQFTESVLPNIRGDAITAGGFGGSQQNKAQQLASSQFLRQVGDTSAGIQAQAYQDSLDAMTRSLFAAPATANLQFLPSSAIGAVGAQNQQLAQAQLSEQAQRFMAEQMIPFSVAQDIAALAFGVPGGSTTATSQISGGGGGNLGGILGGLGMLASIVGAPFSGGSSLTALPGFAQLAV